jgi:drug/metabolite transporter (DMT)-like permease
VHAGASQRGAPGRIAVSGSVFLIIVIWAFNFIAAKIGLRHIPAPAMGSLRVVFAGIALIPVYVLASRAPALANAKEATRSGFSWSDVWIFSYLGFFGVAVNQLCFTMGLQYTSVSHAAVIVGMGPIYALMLAVLFRLEKATGHKVIGMGIAMLGVAVLAAERGITSHSASLLGDGIMMTGSVGFAMYVVLGKRVAGKYNALTMTAFNHFAGALIVLPLALHEVRSVSASSGWHQVSWQSWAALLYMAVFSSALAYVFYFWLLQYLEASQLAAFTYLLPILATILGIVWLGERGSVRQVIGGVLALGGVYWVESGREHRPRPQ